MKLKLFWKDTKKNNYLLGYLYNIDSKYCFEINEEGLKEAIIHGCFGIGEFDLIQNKYISDTLFPFFKRRLPKKENIGINEVLEQYGLKEYDEMELLRRTKGELHTDRYYLEE